jgi:HD-GYP domain-containing protein (c-di-GMP phosphodiesterase class II)
MRFRTRAFLCCFVPFALLLAGSFRMIQNLVELTVREGLRTSLKENHKSLALVLSKSDLQNSRFLKIAGENAGLKAGVQLLLSNPRNIEARATVEDQLRELCERMGFAMLMVSGPDGPPLAGVLRVAGTVRPLDTASMTSNRSGLMLLDGLAYQVASEPIDQADENIGMLSVGEVFDFSEFTTPTVLLHNGHVLKSSIGGVGLPEVEAAMSHCLGTNECNVHLRGANYISLPMQSISFGDGNLLRSLQNLDSAVAPVQSILRNAFGSVALGAVLLALMVSVASAGSIVRPIATLVEHLKQAERSGDLMEFRFGNSPVTEIRRLIESFNRAALAIREGRENLTLAYVEFVQSLANALDARDPYTAGHSERVSRMSRAVAQAMSLPAETVERVTVGALLHDIGKIGIADSLLRKPGRLTAEESTAVREHPVIGRRILEGVHGFSPYLAAVELHHENWDGTGYPHGQSGETTPVDARIIHVADAYDAMVTDRPYRNGMTHEEALRELKANAGKQFDPEVVRQFLAQFAAQSLAIGISEAAQDRQHTPAGYGVC